MAEVPQEPGLFRMSAHSPCFIEAFWSQDVQCESSAGFFQLELPAAAGRLSHHRDGPRRRRQAGQRAGGAPVSARLPQSGAGKPGRRGGAGTGRRPAGHEHRFVCRAAPVFSRRIDRRAGGERHGERPGRLRRGAEVSERQLHPGRGLSAGAVGGDCRGHGARPRPRRA